MALYEVTVNGPINVQPGSVVEEVVQNVRMILATRKGTVPLDRNFGVSWDHLDGPMHIAKALTRTDIIEAIEAFEPRAKVRSVRFDETNEDAIEGITRPTVVLDIEES